MYCFIVSESMDLACPYPLIQFISTPILSCNDLSQARIFILCDAILCPLPYLPFVMKVSLRTFLLFYLPLYVHSRAAPSPTTKDLFTIPSNVPKILTGPQYKQQREQSDPSAAKITATFVSANALSDTCSISKTKSSMVKDRIGDTDVTYWNMGSYFFNISSSSLSQSLKTVPLSFCSDQFNTIIKACITDSVPSFWGGSVVGGGTTYSISNEAFP